MLFKSKRLHASFRLIVFLSKPMPPIWRPSPHRGKLNHPALVRHVAEEVAKLKGIGLEALTDATTTNFFRLFGVDGNA
jgi:hypothetical protein